MKFKLSIILLFISISICSQNLDFEKFKTLSDDEKKIWLKEKSLKIDSLTKLNYLDRDYKYLDKNFKITIPKDTFDFAVGKYKFFKERIRGYKDSLNVLMVNEFDDFDEARIASLRISYTWKRLGYHLWYSEKQMKLVAEKNGFSHPYRFKKFLDNDNIKTEKRKIILENLKTKMLAEGFCKLDTFPSTAKLLGFAFRENPERQRDFKSFKEKAHSRKKN